MTETLVPEVDLNRLGRRFQALQLRLATLQGQARELKSRQTTLTREISLAKARIELAPEVTETFNYLQEKAHARAVGEFEDLLSAFVADVIPDAGRVHLELGTERGAPALDIQLDNAGDLESILDGNGGGLTNVVVTGVGYSALSRTSNRQLMVLDEPDCWLKSVNVPNFTKVIAEVANPRHTEDGSYFPGCQTLMISHNDIGLMDEGAHVQDLRVDLDLAAFADRHGVEVVEVGTKSAAAYVVWVPGFGRKKDTIEVRYRDDAGAEEERNALTKGYPYLASISGARYWEADDEVGIRWIEVSNVRTHVHTRMDLSSGLNVLTGQVNAGKSNLYFTSLRAMAYGESDDSMIRHGADCAVIRVGLEGGVILEMVRSRKGSPKVLYRRYVAGKLVNEARPEKAGAVPDFIGETLRVQRVDGLDIQLRSQKSPVFLLNESPSRRARLLSVGRESGLLQSLIEKHRLELKRDRDDVKRNEAELNQVNRTLTVLAPVADLTALTGILTGVFEDATERGENLKSLRALMGRLEPLASQAALLTAVEGRLSTNLEVPNVVDTKALTNVLARLTSVQHAAQLPDVVELPLVPALADAKALGTVVEGLARGQHMHLLIGALPVAPEAPALKDTPALRTQGMALAAQAKDIETVTKEEQEVATAQAQAERALHDHKHELGVCPLCDTPFKEAQHV